MFKSLLVASFAMSLLACAPAYVPNVINAPLLSHKGQVQVSVNGGVSGFDPQGAYGVTEHIGIMLNGSFAERENDSTDNFHRHKFGELGIGYFTSFNKIGRFEIYGGYGMGNTASKYKNSWLDEYANARIERAFVQPSVGLSTEIVDFAFSPRIAHVTVIQRSEFRTAYFLEPALTLRLGYRYLKSSLQFGFSVPLHEELPEFNYQPILLSIGLQGCICRWKKRE